MANTVKICLVLLLLNAALYAQESKVKFSGLMYLDYFYNVENTKTSAEDLNGFQLRRIYTTVDYAVSNKLSTRFRLETDQSSGSLTSGGKFGVMVKDAYVKYKGIFKGSDIYAGISPTPAFSVSEKAWGYRSLEKTTMDLFKVVSSRDFGIDLKGKLNESGDLSYWVKIGNNSGNSPEVDKYKRFYGMLHFEPNDNFQISVYGDYSAKPQKVDSFNGESKSNNQFVGALFLNYFQKQSFSIGVETFIQNVQNDYQKSPTEELASRNGLGLSAFAWVKLSDDFKFIARYDKYDSNTDAENDAKSFFIAGLDYKFEDNFSIIPNFELFDYEGKDVNDLTLRVTLAANF